MKKTDLMTQISELLAKRGKTSMPAREIARELRLSNKNIKQIQHILHSLTDRRPGSRSNRSRGEPRSGSDLVTGYLEVFRSGDAVVINAGGERSATIEKRHTGTALPGDRVLVQMSLSSRNLEIPVGRIVRIEERARCDIVGTLRSSGRFLYVVPLDPSYSKDFYVPQAQDAKIGDRVVVRFVDWTDSHINPEAEIVEVLGPADKPSVDTISILRHYGFQESFPPAVVAEAISAPSLMEKSNQRMDLRNEHVITIDPVRARDFDDALSLAKDARGNRVLGIHIADVAHFIRPGSLLDKEALRRGNSVYLPDKVIPMLPEQLSNGICSLRPKEDRFTISVFLTFDAGGKVIARSFARTIICSRQRLTYEEALTAIADSKTAGETECLVKDEQTVDLLIRLNDLAQQLRGHRMASHSLDLDIPEFEIQLNEQGVMVGIRAVRTDLSHQLVEECMIAANEAVARELTDRGLPVLYRIHEKPKPEKIMDLSMDLNALGFSAGDLSQRRNLARFLTKVKDDPLAYHIHVAVLRSMNKAVYSIVHNEHFGLAKGTYCHFTSPIRRYPDLIIHRQLASILDAKQGHVSRQPGQGATPTSALARPPASQYTPDRLREIAASCTRTEIDAADAERHLIEMKKYRFLQQQIEGNQSLAHEAVIVNVANFGLFVELLDLHVQGLIHVSALSDQFARFDRKLGTLRAGRDVFKVGNKLAVCVERIDFDKRRIDFVLEGRKTAVSRPRSQSKFKLDRSGRMPDTSPPIYDNQGVKKHGNRQNFQQKTRHKTKKK